MTHKTRSTFVITDPNEFLEALVGLKDVKVLHYERDGPNVELMVEQVVEIVLCPSCGKRAEVKERPVVDYTDLPVYGVAMRLAWKKHRMRSRRSAHGRPVRVLDECLARSVHRARGG